MPAEPVIFHWDPEDDPDGNWQHVFEGHDVEPDEVEQLIAEYLGLSGVCIRRPDESFMITALSATGRTPTAVFRVVAWDPPRVRVITCFPREE
jgi:hypothetical protein